MLLDVTDVIGHDCSDWLRKNILMLRVFSKIFFNVEQKIKET